MINYILKNINDFIWGLPLIIILFGTHMFLTWKLKFIQKYVFKGIQLSLKADENQDGEISQFGALATALAATIGTGNIVGVSTAIASGGAGAVFWTWITGIFGMATKYSESLLSMLYRTKNAEGEVVGGPMYVLERALNKKWLGVLFAVFTVFATLGTGCAVQSHAISNIMAANYSVPEWFSGVVITIFASFVILGGVKKIAKVCEKLVPFMALFYIIGCIIILAVNYKFILGAISLIMRDAFSLKAVTGGILGRAVIMACRYGIARGLFSNESGLGTAPIISATAKSKNPCRQALVSMTGTFYDTVIVCAITGIVIVSSMLHFPNGYTGAGADQLTNIAFNAIPFDIGKAVLSISLSIFAFTTILGWAYYGERCAYYLFGNKAVKLYRIVFLVMLVLGAVMNLTVIWNFSDIMNGLMVVPNVISLIALSKVIVDKTRYYIWENRLDNESDNTVNL